MIRDLTLKPFQEEAVELMVGRGNALLALTMGLGKGHPLDTAVLTPDGWRSVGDLEVGDFVIGSDGNRTKVTGVHHRGALPTYKVWFNDRTCVEVDGDHLWYVESPSHRKSGLRGEVLETRQLADPNGTAPTRPEAPASRPTFQTYFRDRHGNNRWAVPNVGVVTFADRRLCSPFDGYTLGVLLGDGGLTGMPMLTTHVDDWPHFKEHVKLDFGRAKPDYRNQATVNVSIRGVRGALRDLGLYGKRSWEKHVPQEFLLADPATRLSVLQGLMDTDGYAHPDGGSEYSTTSPQLAEDAAFLARSLGGSASIRWRTTDGRPAARVNIKLPPGMPLFRLPRKAAAYREPTKYLPCKVITDVEWTAEFKEIVCISVDAPDHLYVTEGFTLTHNTVTTIAAIEELYDNGAVKTGFIIVPSSLKYQWQREIRRFTGQLALVIDGPKDRRERLYKSAFRYRYVVTNYESIVNDWIVVRDLPMDFIVCDEATALKSFTSKRSKKVKFLAKRTDVKFALTGQPIENRPEELFSIMEFVDPEVLGDFKRFDQAFIVRNKWGAPARYRNLDKLNERMADVMYRKSRADVADQFPRVNTAIRPFYLSREEAAIYTAVSDHVLQLLTDATAQFGTSFNLAAHYGAEVDPMADQMRGDIMSGIMLLRQIADDPNLAIESADNFDSGKGTGSKLASELRAQGLFAKVPKVSTKREMFIELLEQALSEDDDAKVVAFSTFKGLLRSIAEDTKSITRSTSLTGDMNAKERDLSIQKFKQDPNTRLFLSSDAGGYGVDLPNANHLVSLDLPWSTGSYEQREARIIRISSEFEQVFITMLLAQGSIDMRMQEMIDQKGGIAEAWLDGKSDAKGGFELSLGSLTQFLLTAQLRP